VSRNSLFQYEMSLKEHRMSNEECFMIHPDIT